MTGGNKNLHKNAADKIRGRLEAVLRSSVLRSGSPAFNADWFDAVIDLEEETVKHCGAWLEGQDVLTIVSRELSEALLRRGRLEDVSGPLTELLDPEEIKKLASSITAFIESVPRPYRMSIPLPGIKLPTDIALSERLLLKHLEGPPTTKGQGLRGLSAFMKPSTEGPHLIVRVSGYADGLLQQSAFRAAVAAAKRVLYIFIINGVLKEKSDVRALRFLLDGKAVQYLEATPADENDPHRTLIAAQLPLSFSRFVQRLELAEDAIKDAEELKRRIAPGATLTVDFFDKPEVRALGSALQWAFDAASEDDGPMALVKTCIALEAALAEDSEKEQITERLADRCAFLLGTSSGARSVIRAQVRDLYRIRSQIVHGSVTELTSPQLSQLRRATRSLNRILQREIDGLWRQVTGGTGRAR